MLFFPTISKFPEILQVTQMSLLNIFTQITEKSDKAKIEHSAQC